MGFSGTSYTSTVLDASGAVYPGCMERQLLGHFSQQYSHWMHCILSMVSVLAALSAWMAPTGQFLPQRLHRMQFELSNSRCPLLASG